MKEFGYEHNPEQSFVAPQESAPKPSQDVLNDVSRRRKEGLARPEGIRSKNGQEQSKVDIIYARDISSWIDAIALPEKTAEEMARNPELNKVAQRIAELIRKNSEFPVMQGWLIDEIRKNTGKKGIEAFADLVSSKLNIK